jgi:hypothetical protein
MSLRFPRRCPEPLSADVSCRLSSSSSSKSSLLATAGCELARIGLERPIELPRGTMDDCRRGEDPSAVFIGDRDFGGGRRVRSLRRIAADVVMAGIEPVRWDVSTIQLRQPNNVRQFIAAIPRTLLYVHGFRSCHVTSTLRWRFRWRREYAGDSLNTVFVARALFEGDTSFSAQRISRAHGVLSVCLFTFPVHQH